MDTRGVLLDFDGVINDSFREGLRRIKVICALHDVEFTRNTRAKLTALWGLPGVQLFMQGLGMNEDLAERLYIAWEKYDKTDPIPLVPGAREVLVWLRRNGFTQALITSRNRKNLREILDLHDIEKEFLVITTKEDCPYHKPDPRVFNFALETLKAQCGIEKDECIFVGDTPSDTVAGKNAELETLVVQTGPYFLEHITTHPIQLGNILRSLDDLPLWIEKHHEGNLKELYQ